MFCEHHDAFGETRRRAQELVDGAAGGELVESAEGCDGGLLDAFAFAAVVRDLEVRIGISKRQYTLVEKYRMGWPAWFER